MLSLLPLETDYNNPQPSLGGVLIYGTPLLQHMCFRLLLSPGKERIEKERGREALSALISSTSASSASTLVATSTTIIASSSAAVPATVAAVSTTTSVASTATTTSVASTATTPVAAASTAAAVPSPALGVPVRGVANELREGLAGLETDSCRQLNRVQHLQHLLTLGGRHVDEAALSGPFTTTGSLGQGGLAKLDVLDI